MAAITIANCTVSPRHAGPLKMYTITTPTTADAGDTIDVSTLFDFCCFTPAVSSATDLVYMDNANVWDDLSVTLPNGAATTSDEARIILVMGW